MSGELHTKEFLSIKNNKSKEKTRSTIKKDEKTLSKSKIQKKPTLAISTSSTRRSSAKNSNSSITSTLNSKTNSKIVNEFEFESAPYQESETGIIEEFKYLFLELLSEKLEEIASENSKVEKSCPKDFIEINQTLFYNPELPEISIRDYLVRIASLCKVEISTCILASIYIDRLCQEAVFYLTWRNVYRYVIILNIKYEIFDLYFFDRVILTGFIIALKYNEDIIYKQDYISSVGGVSKKELGTLEYSFLELIDYNLFVSSNNYSYCLNEVIHEITNY